MWKRVTVYAAVLAAGTLGLQWAQLQWVARTRPGDLAFGLVALGFLVLGFVLGARLFARAPRTEPGNPAAQAALGISARELEVLQELAAGRSNKEIAARLKVSPNTVKTHVARLYEKLEARRRTDAVNKARDLGLVG